MPIVVTNPDGSTREITKEEFLADLEKAKAQARKKAAEEEHVRKLREEQQAENARDNRRVNRSPSANSWSTKLSNGIVELLNKANMEYKVNGNSIIVRTDEADYEQTTIPAAHCSPGDAACRHSDPDHDLCMALVQHLLSAGTAEAEILPERTYSGIAPVFHPSPVSDENLRRYGCGISEAV